MVKYDGFGLDNIWLKNGYKWIETGHGRALAVDNVEQLEHAMARHLAGQAAPLTGQAFRFLRDMLAMSQDAFGKAFGRDYQTVARWEAASAKPVPQSADAMIRQLYLERQGRRPLFTDLVEKLAASARNAATSASVSFHENADGTWQADPVQTPETVAV
jgi:DNA-binding transcriptional regulator YiaG